MLMLGQRGFGRRVEAIIIVFIATTIVFLVIAVLGQKKQGRRENEAAAIASLQAVGTAMKSWYADQTPPSYAGVTLSALSQAYPLYIDAELGKGLKDGYTFTLLPISLNEYICIAIPMSQGVSGSRTLSITESGIVKAKAGEDWYPVE